MFGGCVCDLKRGHPGPHSNGAICWGTQAQLGIIDYNAQVNNIIERLRAEGP